MTDLKQYSSTTVITRDSSIENESSQGKPSQPDNVNHPIHYTTHPSGIECIEITRHMNFNLGNAMKYIWRSNLKNGLEDLEKAIWYIKDEIKKRQAGK